MQRPAGLWLSYVNNMIVAVFPGSFDPPTWGHLGTISRAAPLVDHLYVAVAQNQDKNHWFSLEQRCSMIAEAITELDLPATCQVTVAPVSGLLVEFCQAHHANFIIKGVRNSVDFAAEQTQAEVNLALGGPQTLFIGPESATANVSSSLVRQVFGLGGDVSPFVPPQVITALLTRQATHVQST